MSLHARLAPSAAHRWIRCPGSVQLSDSYPDSGSDFADEGTFAHEIAAQCLRSGQDVDVYVGSSSPGGRFTVDEEFGGHVQAYLDVVRSLQTDTATLLVEERVHVNQDVWGTADAIVYDPDSGHLHVVDLKFGRGVLVDVQDNPQLMIYALGAWNYFRNIRSLPPVKRVTIHVVQPRHPQGGHTSQDLSLTELQNFEVMELATGVERVCAEDSTLCAGDWCRFCPAKSGCPEFRNAALAQARHLFADPPDAIVPVDPSPTPLKAQELTNEQMANALRAFPVMEHWIKVVRAEAYARANSGKTLPGFKLVRKRTHRRWTDETAASEALRLFTDDADRLFKLVTPAQAEKVLGKHHADVVESLVTRPEGETTLAAEKDSRPAVTAGEVFKAISETDNLTEEKD